MSTESASSKPRVRPSLGWMIVLVISGTVVVLSSATLITEWYAQYRHDIASKAQQSHALGAVRPTAEHFFPTRVLEEQPIVEGYRVMTVAESEGLIKDSEQVLAVEINGEARAWPLNVMTGPAREVFNDTLGGRSIAATW